MSAQSYMLGLYPTGLSSFNAIQMKHVENLLAPPISLTVSNDVIRRLKEQAMPFGQPMVPIMSVNENVEKTLLTSACPWFSAQVNSYFSSEQYRKLIQETFKQMWEQIIAAYPEVTWDYLIRDDNADVLCDFIIAVGRDGRKPSRLSDNVMLQLEIFKGDIHKGMFGVAPLQNKIAMADYTQEVLEFMNATIEARTRLKYVLYSAHDTTQANIFLGLRQMNASINLDKIPNFASNLLFELHGPQDSRVPSDHHVTIYHNGTAIHNESYPAFKLAFAALGDMGMSREQACNSHTGGKPIPQRRVVGLPEDFH